MRRTRLRTTCASSIKVVTCPNIDRLALAHCLVCIAFGAPPKPVSSVQQSTPTINVVVYSFHGLPPWVLDETKAEANRIFEQAKIQVNWVDSNSEKDSASRPLAGSAIELAVRLVPHALPPASKTALAMAFPSAEGAGSAFIFYDRVVAMQTSTSLLQTMLGRVVAHEIVHLLLPQHKHSHSGLMRSDWTRDDLRFTSRTIEILSSNLVPLLPRRQAPPSNALPLSAPR
jgi:hypothetical protein